MGDWPEQRYDAVVVGAGPNGLSAAIALARAGWAVLLVEAKETVGGGCRSAELTLPGFVHDVCSAIHPLAFASPFFRTLPLERHGLRWVHPTHPVAQPLGGQRAAVLEQSVDATAAALGRDGPPYRRRIGPLVARFPEILEQFLGPLRLPRHPVRLARFALAAVRSARGWAESAFAEEPARALFSGLAAHAFSPLDRPTTAGFGLLLAAAGHAVGWPAPAGGSQTLANALASHFRSLGGDLVTGRTVDDLGALPPSSAILLDLTPRQALRIAGNRLPSNYRRRLERYRYGAGVFKVDFALDGPVPWSAPACALAGTLHLGGTLEEVAASEAAVAAGRTPESPYVLVAQHSAFDPSRAPQGKHTLWTYCHVPNGSPVDMTQRIETQIERFAPGFRDLVLAKRSRSPEQLERENANDVGGDICGGAQDGLQLFFRPTMSLRPYATPVPGLYFCSSSTPPGPGVHGMCGFHAATAALRDVQRNGR